MRDSISRTSRVSVWASLNHSHHWYYILELFFFEITIPYDHPIWSINDIRYICLHLPSKINYIYRWIYHTGYWKRPTNPHFNLRFLFLNFTTGLPKRRSTPETNLTKNARNAGVAQSCWPRWGVRWSTFTSDLSLLVKWGSTTSWSSVDLSSRIQPT